MVSFLNGNCTSLVAVWCSMWRSKNVDAREDTKAPPIEVELP